MSKEFDLFSSFKRALGSDYDLSSKTFKLNDGTEKTVAEILHSFGGRENLLMQSHICELDKELRDGRLINTHEVTKKVGKGELFLKASKYEMHDGVTRELSLIGRVGEIAGYGMRIFFGDEDWPKSVKINGSYDWITSPAEMWQILKYFLY